VLFLLGLLSFAFALQFSSGALGSVDGYFHIRYSAILADAGWGGFPPAFPWLPLTILAPDRYFDHHMLFHLWLAPFTRGDLVLGAKLASAIGAWLAFAGSYLFLLWRRVRRAEWWTIALLAGAPGFLYRMEMPRVQSLSLLFLVAALALLTSRRFVWLVPLMWLYTWLNDAFPLLLAMCACASLAEVITERTFPLAPLGYGLLGAAGSLLVNPYFPHDLQFIAVHFATKLNLDDSIPVGAEWYLIPLTEWLGWPGLLAILCGLGALVLHHRREIDRERLTSVLVAALFLALMWHSARFVEYFVPFTTIALAQIAHLPLDERLRRAQPRWRRCAAAALLAWLAASSTIAIVKLRSRPPATQFAGGARWIAERTPPEALVFNTGWDDFPLLYFHNTRNRYVIGLDPTYLAERDLDLYRRWEAISNGQTARPAAAIRDRFGASVAFTDRHHSAFIEAMQNDPLATKAYEDQECIVYRVGGEPVGARATR
jgi:hypothetical protein